MPAITDDGLLTKTENNVERREQEEENRVRSVDSRLIPLLGLASVIATLLTAGIPLSITGRIQGLSDLQLALLLVPLAYLALQLLRCLYAALSGLTRRDYRALESNRIAPKEGESVPEYRVRILNERRRSVAFNAWVTDTKVSQMAVAHTALRNLLVGIAVLLITGLAVAGIERWDDKTTIQPQPSASPTATTNLSP